MNKLQDATIVKAWNSGYDDFLASGPNTPCPFDLESQEGKYWIMGYEDAFDDYRKHPDDLENYQ